MNAKLFRHRHLGTVFLNLITAAVSVFLAFLLRFDFTIPHSELESMRTALLIALVTKTVSFQIAQLHRGWWRFVGITDVVRIVIANLAASFLFTISCLVIIGFSFPRSVYIVDFVLCLLLTAGPRFAVRLYNEALCGELQRNPHKAVIIYGAGAAGVTLLREISANPLLGYEVVGFLDDDEKKWNALVMGAPVLGPGRDAPRIVELYRGRKPPVEEILIAMPSAKREEMRDAVANCRAAGITCKTVPALPELLRERGLSNQIRSISVSDLLGRRPILLEEQRIREHVSQRSVLVTGAGGSIGSELCRQLARFGPRRLIALDQAESDLFRIDLELRQVFQSLRIYPEVADICDSVRIEEIVNKHSVDSIFHAAAYKHVPLMETNMLEAVRNNILGTWNVAQAANRSGVRDFIMISSDKAVNPTNIMGLTKRVSELLVSSMESSDTKFVSVRFGNVLGSNGSVVPLFEAQIAAGGPVTVTHPEVRRYFMTITEAVQLVLQASTMGKGSEIFVLDMGDPIKIADLARTMIRMAKLEPDRDIEIRFVGLRPGEKLFEELITEGEDIMPTYHDKIKIFQSPPPDAAVMNQWVAKLRKLIELRDEFVVLDHLRVLAPEYKPGELWDKPQRRVPEIAHVSPRLRQASASSNS